MDKKMDVTTTNPVCVVVDTNLWRSNLLLKNPVGVSLVYTLRRQGGFLVLPEVVERELTKQVVQHGLEAAQKLEDSSRIVDTLVGIGLLPHIPTANEIAAKVDARLEELAPILLRIPFTLQQAQAALDMVNAGLLPNRQNNQQFKDSAIWQAILGLADTYRVFIVTNDRAFLMDPNDPTKGLAGNLRDDCEKAGLEAEIFCDLGSCLERIRSEVPSVDKEHLASMIVAYIAPQLRLVARQQKVEYGDLLHAEVRAFQTPSADCLAVDYTLTMQFEEIDPSASEVQYADCHALKYGSCFYDLRQDLITGNLVQRITLERIHATGHYITSRSFAGDTSGGPFSRRIP